MTATRMLWDVGIGEHDERQKGEEGGTCRLRTEAVYEGLFAGMSLLALRCDVRGPFSSSVSRFLRAFLWAEKIFLKCLEEARPDHGSRKLGDPRDKGSADGLRAAAAWIGKMCQDSCFASSSLSV